MRPFRTSASWRRIDFDLHSVLGIYSLVFLFVVVNGPVMSFPNRMYSVVKLLTSDTTKEGPRRNPRLFSTARKRRAR